VSECRSKFGVAADPDQKITREYDSILAAKPEYANRTSYVITPEGRILYEYTSLDPALHVQNTMAVLKAYLSHPSPQ
jgi:peroxiredoxin